MISVEQDPRTTQLMVTIAATAVVTLCVVVQAIYNIYFHPLSKFPGPKLAAASSWWLVYLEVIKEKSLSL